MWIRSKRFLVLSEHPDTVAVHAGRLEIPANTASSPPLFQASSYEFADLADVRSNLSR
jgi:O-acetylhomoserine/O-acetylserine sulfhydrylase-like pyridoxal-dependent enzyme